MTSREFKYHYTVRTRKDWFFDIDKGETFYKPTLIIKRIKKSDRLMRRILKFATYGYDATILQPNFALLMPTDIARNPDGTPKQFDAEKIFPVYHDEPKMWDSYEDVKERERLQTEFNKHHFKFRGPDDIGFNQ